MQKTSDSRAQKRLDGLVEFVNDWTTKRPDLSLDQDDIEQACQGGYADGLTVSENLKVVKQTLLEGDEPVDLASPEKVRQKLEGEQLGDKLLLQWYLRFFSSLQLEQRAAQLAVASEALGKANESFDPTAFMKQELTYESMTEFWVSAAPELARLTFEALQSNKQFAEEQAEGKFRDTIKLGDLDAFYLGLDGVIGLPKLKVLEAMREEHDSDEDFTAYNQGKERRTCPSKEWERVLPEGVDGKVNSRDYDGTRELCGACGQDFMQHPTTREAGLLKEEVVALRLYTSPMYVKYNAELRELLEASLELQHTLNRGSSKVLSIHSLRSPEAVKLLEEARKRVKFVTTIHAIVSGLIKLSKHSPLVERTYRGIHGKAIPSCFLLPGSKGGRGGVEYGFMSTSKSKVEAMSYAAIDDSEGMPVVFEILMGMVDRGADLGWISFFPREQEILMPPLSKLELAGNPRYEELPIGPPGAPRKTVMILPLQVNVNLKSLTLDQLQQRRKDLHIQTFTNLISEVEREFRSLEPEMGVDEEEAPYEAVRCSSRSMIRTVSEDLVPEWAAVNLSWSTGMGVSGRGFTGPQSARTLFHIGGGFVLKQCREVLQKHADTASSEFNDDVRYKEALEEALLTKLRARRKLQVLFSRHRQSSSASALEHIKTTPLQDFTEDFKYYPLLCGLDDFPWRSICEGTAREVVLEPRSASLLHPRLTPFQLRLALKCIWDHAKTVQLVQYGSFSLEPRGSTSRGEAAGANEDGDDGEVPVLGYGELLVSARTESDEGQVGAETLRLKDCKMPLSHDGGMLVSFVVQSSSSLASLDLSGCKLFSAGSKNLAKGLLAAASSLTELDLTKCALGLEGGEAILEALRLATGLQGLSLRNNVLSDKGWNNLAMMLQAATSLKGLDAAYCCLSVKPAERVAAALKGLTELVLLDLRGSIMEAEVAECVAESVVDLRSLMYVNGHNMGRGMSNTAWEDKNLYAFGEVDGGLVASMVERNTQLTALNNLVLEERREERGALVLSGVLRMWRRADLPLAFLRNALRHRAVSIRLEDAEYSGEAGIAPLERHVRRFIGKINQHKVMQLVDSPEELRRAAEAAAGKKDVERLRLLQTADEEVDEDEDQGGDGQRERGRQVDREGARVVRIRANGEATEGAGGGPGTGKDEEVEAEVEEGSEGERQRESLDMSYGGQRMLVQAALSGGPEVCLALMLRTSRARLDSKDMEGRTSLMRAARDGREAVVRTLIWRGADVNAQDSEGRSAIMFAAGRGWDNVVELLINSQADIEMHSLDGWNAFHFASMYAPDRTVITLLERASERAVSMAGFKKGNTPLHHAATYGKQRMVLTLLQHGAPVDAHSKMWRTPLMEAATGGNTYVLQCLLEAHASLSSSDRRGTTALMEAARKGHCEVVKMLISAEDEELAPAEGDGSGGHALLGDSAAPAGRAYRPLQSGQPKHPLLRKAATEGQLLSPGKRRASDEGGFGRLVSSTGQRRVRCANKQDEQGWTALMLAVANGHARVVKALLEDEELDVNLRQHEARTALMLAASNGLREVRDLPTPTTGLLLQRHASTDWNRTYVVEGLVRRKAAVNARDKAGRTAVMEAARNGQTEVVEKLLSLNAEPNAKTQNRWTALMFAADRGHFAVVDVLLDAGVNVNIKGKDGRTAMDLAARKGHDKVSKRLSAAISEHVPRDDGDRILIVPRKVPARFLPYVAPRDKYDLMHSRGSATALRLDTRVFLEEPLNELFQTPLKHKLQKLPTALEMTNSPLSAITLRGDARTAARIPDEACYFSFCYPSPLLEGIDASVFENSEDTSADELVTFLRNGAFIYFSGVYDICGINSVNVEDKKHAVLAEESGLAFDTDLPMQRSSSEYLERWNRWTLVTVDFLRHRGFTHFAWINPSEVLGDNYINPYGGFAYKTKDGAFFYPLSSDGGDELLAAPHAPFTTKVDGTSDEESDTASDSSSVYSMHHSDSMSRFPFDEDDRERSGLSFSGPRRERSLHIQSGVTGLLEVRMETLEYLHHHLLTYAREERERLAREHPAGFTPDEFSRFKVDVPHTWTNQDLPAPKADDSPLDKEEKVLTLAQMHAILPADKQLRMPVPLNLLRITSFGRPGQEPRRICDFLFAEDVRALTSPRKKWTALYLDRAVLDWTSDRTKTYLSKAKSVKRLEQTAEQTAVSHCGKRQRLFKLVGSPINQVTLPEEAQVRAGIPKEARFYCFCYPLLFDKVEELASKHKKTPTDALGCFLRLGGFLYFDEMYRVVAVTALSVSAADKEDARCVIHLGPPIDLPATAIPPLEAAKRWWPVAHKAAARLGYSHMAYIRPCEVVAEHVFCGHGAFAYRAGGSSCAHLYPVLQSFYDIDYGEERRYRARYQPRKFDLWMDATGFVPPRGAPRRVQPSDSARPGARSRCVRGKRFTGGAIPVGDAGALAGGGHWLGLVGSGGGEDSEEEVEAVRGEVGAGRECCEEVLEAAALGALGKREEAAGAGLSRGELAALRVLSCGCEGARRGWGGGGGGGRGAEGGGAWGRCEELAVRGLAKLQRWRQAVAVAVRGEAARRVRCPLQSPIAFNKRGSLVQLAPGHASEPSVDYSGDDEAEPDRSLRSLSEAPAASPPCPPAPSPPPPPMTFPAAPPSAPASGSSGAMATSAPASGSSLQSREGAAQGGGAGLAAGVKRTLREAPSWSEEEGGSPTSRAAGGGEGEEGEAAEEGEVAWAWRGLPRGSEASPSYWSLTAERLVELLAGGWAEAGPASATRDWAVAAAALRADGGVDGLDPGSEPVLLRIQVGRADEMPPDIAWLSPQPEEAELVFPPCTRFTPIYAQQLRIRPNPAQVAYVLTCRPTLPDPHPVLQLLDAGAQRGQRRQLQLAKQHHENGARLLEAAMEMLPDAPAYAAQLLQDTSIEVDLAGELMLQASEQQRVHRR